MPSFLETFGQNARQQIEAQQAAAVQAQSSRCTGTIFAIGEKKNGIIRKAS